MTPPDSDARCSWIVSGARSGRCLLSSNHVGPHKPDDPREPDSGERCACPPSDRALQSRGLLLRHVKACPLRTVLNAPVPDAREPNLPCPHGRPTWRMCPHCLGLNAPISAATTPVVNESIVVLSNDLAQRILAALETPSIFGSDHRVDLARELRALVTK